MRNKIMLSERWNNLPKGVLYENLTDMDLGPTKGTVDSTGYDLRSAVTVTIQPGGRAAVPTGIRLDLSNTPTTLDVQVRPRSGLAINRGVTVLNSPGTIDRDYTGEVKVILINHGEHAFDIKPGDRIAQLVFGNLSTVTISEGEVEDNEGRGSGGFGSTGT